MSEATNKNHLKTKAPEEEVVETEKKKVVSKEKIASNPLKNFIKWFQVKRNQQIIGAVFIFLAFVLFFSFSSYLFTWKEDQSLMFGGMGDFFFNNKTPATNWLGKLGAALSYSLVNNLFGIAGFLMVLNLFIWGFRLLFSISLIPIGTLLRQTLFLLPFISITLNFLLGADYVFAGGAVGYDINQFLVNLLGMAGTSLILLLAVFLYVVVTFNPSFDGVTNFFSSAQKEILEPVQEPVTATGNGNSFYDRLRNAELIDEEDLEFEEPFIKDENSEPLPQEPVFEMPMFIDEDPIAEPVVEEDIEEIEVDGQKLEITKPMGEEELSEDLADRLLREKGEYDPTLDLGTYKFPTLDLMEDYGVSGSESRISKEELTANQKKIIDTLKNYKIEIAKISASIGPTVTLYEIVPAPGIKISKIQSLENDIALSLAALGIRIIAPIPGRGTIGIEVPNAKAEMVPMKSLLRSDKFVNAGMELPVALGKTISNETFVADLAKMPHLLMAGATGQGKSVGLNAILVSLLYKKHPSQIKFVLVDPKKVELTLFNKIERHFLAKLPDDEDAIITDTKKVVKTLNSLCIEMDNRYELLKDAQVRNISEYNKRFIERRLNPEKGHKFLPYIVVVVDEFADLIMTAGKEVEMPIARIAQLARAVGIHLIIATQRPSVNIITGVIKANFPARIAFRVSSRIDSRTILDSGGAEQLIGRGDMLFSNGNDLIRIQCGFVDTPEVERITEFIGDQRGYPTAFFLPEVMDEDAADRETLSAADRDELFEEAASIVVQHQQGSASLLQRKLQLGYNRAGRLIDQLEAAGIVGPFKGSKAREVLYKDALSLEQFLSNAGNN